MVYLLSGFAFRGLGKHVLSDGGVLDLTHLFREDPDLLQYGFFSVAMGLLPLLYDTMSRFFYCRSSTFLLELPRSGHMCSRCIYIYLYFGGQPPCLTGLRARWEGDTTPPPTFTCRELRECASVVVRVSQHGVRSHRISHFTLVYVFTYIYIGAYTQSYLHGGPVHSFL